MVITSLLALFSTSNVRIIKKLSEMELKELESDQLNSNVEDSISSDDSE